MLTRPWGRTPSIDTATAASVATAYLALALPHGGFAPAVIAAATILVWWAALATLIVRRRRVQVPGAALACGAALAALAVLGAVSLAWASDDGRGYVDVIRAAGYAGLFALVTVAVPPGRSRPWLVGLALGLVAVAVLALGSRFIPSLPDGSFVGGVPIGAEGRMSYPIGYWNALAACMVLGTVLATWLGARASTRAGRALAVAALPLFGLVLYLTSSRGGVAVSVIALAALVAVGPSRPRLLAAVGLGALSSIGLALLARIEPDLIEDAGTQAASAHGTVMAFATLGVAVAVGVAWYLSDRFLERVNAPRRLVRGALAALALIAVVGAVAADPLSRLEEFDDAPIASDTKAGARFTTTSGSGRSEYWATALDAFEEDPLGGLGAGGFQSYWDRYGSTDFVARHAHSAYLETLAELGLPGLLLLASFIAVALATGLRRRASSPDGDAAAWLVLLGAGCLSSAIEWTWELPAAYAPVILAAALLAGRATATSETPAEGEAPTTVQQGEGEGRRALPLPRLGWGLAALAFGGVTICAAALLLFGEAALDDSRDAYDRGDLEAAAQAAFDAGQLEPWAAEPRLQLALVKEAEGDLTAARSALSEARRLAPQDWRTAVVTARVAESQGLSRDAGKAITRARRLNPRLFEPPTQRPDPRDRPVARREVELELVAADDFDPQGTPLAEEHPELSPLAIDGDPRGTAWSTEQYEVARLSGDKQGVGIYVELAEPAAPETIEVVSAAPGWSASVYATGGKAPATLEGWGAPLGSADGVPQEARIALARAEESRFVLLWLTSLAPSPEASGRFSVAISDIGLTGQTGGSP